MLKVSTLTIPESDYCMCMPYYAELRNYIFFQLRMMPIQLGGGKGKVLTLYEAFLAY